ncbi:MAG: DUF4124 domain-containing protein [Pseudomonas sp.]|uniref:DUF4124 domain-containing protein n=1 Tax=Pseudomonas sp. TaxID=306 RepID=UPI00271C5605|nr:DUF4124 domain-containing protein [Pseudomonas sp.]MDO9617581.1 DUF4124 domain-containing protein [Pseudomonas sp.]MDP2447151.1 DUF4124 domain-containing protein [Pseudomonas sp.]MDZ4336490.1 DUF4124 domain-containing protein [Pseudomonas sp.]
MHRSAITRCSLLLGLLLPVVAGAAELYRYVDDKGTTVLSRQGVPPEHIGKGYEVLNDQGRVIQVIPPAPSPEEMKRILADKARATSDAQLLRLYSTPDDVERARQRKLAELDGLIGVARGNLQSVRTQQANLQSQAADHERAGREVPAHLLAQIDNQKAEQARLKGDILRYQAARKEADSSFNADRDRLKELLGRNQ